MLTARKYLTAVRFAVAVCPFTLHIVRPAYAGLFDVEIKLTAADARTDDHFGQAVGMSGNRAIVGAPGNDVSGILVLGSAYLFDVTTGDQLFKLTASQPGNQIASDHFGFSTAISGNTAIVGAFSDDEGTGAAYLFDVTTGDQLFKLTASDAETGGGFGFSVDISGNVAIVGAPFDPLEGFGSGSAYLFDVSTGNQLFKITSSDAVTGTTRFGTSVGISGTAAIVGTPSDFAAGDSSGAAYLFDVNTGDQLYKLTASDAAAFDQFGTSVGINDNTAIVGANLDENEGIRSGSAYLFDVSTGDQLFKLTASDAGPDLQQIGSSVAISGNLAIVGAQSDNDGGIRSGSVYVFDVSTGDQLFKLTASDAAAEDSFGHRVGISGNRVIVGAFRDDDAGSGSGSAYLFVPEPSSCALVVVGLICSITISRRERSENE